MEHLLLPLLALLPQQRVDHVDDPLLPGTHLVVKKAGDAPEPVSPALAEPELLPPQPLIPCSAPAQRRPSFSSPTRRAAFSSSLSCEEWLVLALVTLLAVGVRLSEAKYGSCCLSANRIFV